MSSDPAPPSRPASGQPALGRPTNGRSPNGRPAPLANGVASRDAAPREATPDPTLQHVHVLLLQARSSADMELQEQRCFLERCRLGPDQLASLSVLRDPLHAGVLAEADALLIGGAGEFSAHHDYPWMPSLLKLIRRAAEDGVPTFGSCWGHQVIARAFGGTVVHDSARAELGCCEVELTDAGAADALLSPFPRRFATNQGHHDRVDVLPPEAVELAFSDTQRNEAFRLAGAPVYGTQFHSELDAEAERERLIAYRDFYRADLPDEDAFQAVLDGLAETTEVDHLLHDFLVRFVLDARTAA